MQLMFNCVKLIVPVHWEWLYDIYYIRTMGAAVQHQLLKTLAFFQVVTFMGSNIMLVNKFFLYASYVCVAIQIAQL